ncbi:MAG: LPXTG cell wall anchor domain-containing protein [Desulfoplanes sp.]|nr:LPXTG cell wall anchor domain-containing protein [Desulfoplanes sp.]
MESSSIENGKTGVATDVQIKLVFSKNVTHDSVRLGNETAITIVDQNDQAVDIDVILADSSIREQRNDVLVKAVGGFAEGTTYTLTVDTTMESKSGVTLEKPVKITFTTVENEDAEVTPPAKKADPEDADSEETNPKTGDNINRNIAIAIVTAMVLIGSAGFLSYRKRIS